MSGTTTSPRAARGVRHLTWIAMALWVATAFL